MHKKLFNYAILTGEVMLKNGAETSRVEDTINRILRTSGFETIESFVTPTGIFVTLDDPSIDMISFTKRVYKREAHLRRVSLANDLSRKFCSGGVNLNDALTSIKKIGKEPSYSNWMIILGKSFVAGGFSVIFGGSYKDMVVSTIIGFIVAVIQVMIKKLETSKFFEDIIGGSIIGILAIIFYYYLNIGTNFDLIIIGSIMPLVPGLAITNAIREIIQGDFLSGLSRTADAFIIAASVAVGVGSILKIFYTYIGGAFL